jgi:hypothetical protein
MLTLWTLGGELLSILFHSFLPPPPSLSNSLLLDNHLLVIVAYRNPTTEDQAIARVHRLGQTRAVTITRFVTKNTVEERMLDIHSKKKTLSSSALDGGNISKVLGERKSAKELKDMVFQNIQNLLGLDSTTTALFS